MNQVQLSTHESEVEEPAFDRPMSDLLVLITHHSLTCCENALPNIIDRIDCLTQHIDIECYPEQLSVLLKMQRLWQTKLFRNEVSVLRH